MELGPPVFYLAIRYATQNDRQNKAQPCETFNLLGEKTR